MDFDILRMQGARASTAMVLTYVFWIITVAAPDGLIFWTFDAFSCTRNYTACMKHKDFIETWRRKGHDDAIKWKHLPRHWPFVRGIHRSPVNSPHKGQWRGALMFSQICAWISGWVNNREAGDLRRHRAHYDVIVMQQIITLPTGACITSLSVYSNACVHSPHLVVSYFITGRFTHNHRGYFTGHGAIIRQDFPSYPEEYG